MADDALDHARQIGMAAGIISEAFAEDGFRVTLVGGSAIAIYAPGICKTADIDLVIEAVGRGLSRQELDPAFQGLGFAYHRRPWHPAMLYLGGPAAVLADPP